MLSDSKEHPPSSPLPTNERSGSAVKCRDARVLTHKHFYSGLLAYFSTRVHALCLHVCMWGGWGWNCRQGALMAACFSRVSPGICLHPSSVFNARLHNQSSCRSFWKKVLQDHQGCASLARPCTATSMSSRRHTCTESTFLFLCAKNGTARAPRIAECRLASRGR